MTERVAVIGAGPGGLVAARWLLSEGFETTVFERSAELGGQWAGLSGRSGMWQAMHTNTSRVLTAFSDLEPTSPHVFPSRQEILDYLHRYAALFDLPARIRFGTAVEGLGRAGSRWRIRTATGTEEFDKVVIASGRFHHPTIPASPGLAGFTGEGGVHSTYGYRDPAPYVGRRVLVAGGAISALEIAVELVHHGAASVALTQRRQRYVLPKFAAGVPSDHRMFTRYGALAAESLPPADVDRQLRDIVINAGGSPEQYGAPAPHPSLSTAGVTLCQGYLPLVAEGRIAVHPWMTSIAGEVITFGDGTSDRFDGILLGTGFGLALPFLDDELVGVLGVDDAHFDADRFTFHPELPGLAFVGLWDQSGGYFVPLELQARWIAYAWSGRVAGPDVDDQRRAVEAYRARRGTAQKTRMNLAALTFARAAGVEPDVSRWPHLRRALLFGPLAPSSFRLQGPDSLPEAADRFTRDAAAFGAITSPDLTDGERALLSSVDSALASG